MTLEQQGLLDLREHETADALAHFRDAERLYENTGDVTSLAQAHINAGEALRLLDRWDEAFREYEAARTLYQKASDNAGVGLALHDLGLVAEHRGNLVEAIRLFEQAEHLKAEGLGASARVETLIALGRVLERRGDFARARQVLENAVRVEDRMLETAGAADVRTGLQAYSESPVLTLTVLLAGHGSRQPEGALAQSAFETYQHGRARALQRFIRASSMNQMLKDETMRSQWDRAQRAIATNRTRLRRADLAADARKKTLKALEHAEADAADVLRRWEMTAVGKAGVGGGPFALRDLHASLGREETLIAYALAEPTSYAWVITRDSFHQFELGSASDIGTSVDRLVGALEQPDTAPSVMRTLASEVGKRVLEPILPSLRPGGHLWIVPEGSLLRVPFSVLPLGSANDLGSSAAFLCEKSQVSVLPSASFIKPTVGANGPAPRSGAVLLFGDPRFPTSKPSARSEPKWQLAEGKEETKPAENLVAGRTLRGLLDEGKLSLETLPGSALEIGSIRKLYPPEWVQTWTGEKATEGAFKSADLGRARIIHLSTHAFADPTVAERSAVVFTLDDNPKEDGFLTLPEIMSLRFGPSVVVLSACETAGERVVSGEGLLGLARAFLAAGASAVVATLWPVEDDSTSFFMIEFHKSLRSGRSAAEALASAQRAMLAQKSSSLSSPTAWAAFILIGDGRLKAFSR